MSDFSGKTTRKRRSVLTVALLGACLVMLAVSTGRLDSSAQEFGLFVTGGVQKTIASTGNFLGGLFTAVGQLKRLRIEYDELVLRLERFTALERGYSDLKVENDRLREQLGYMKSAGHERVPARIISRDPENRYLALMLDRGSTSGIERNMAVTAFQGGMEAVVGRVIAVSPYSSKVIPINDVRSFVAARIATTRHEGLVAGQGSHSKPLMLRYITKTVAPQLQYGDLVVTSGFESIFPPDIAIGRIRRIHTPDYLASSEIELDQTLDFSRLEHVFILRKSVAPALPGAGGAG